MTLTDNDLMPFGKYKNVPMQEVPADYLLELKEKGWAGKCNKDVVRAVMNYIDLNWGLLTSVPPMPEPDEHEIDEDIDFDMFNQEL